MSKTAKTIMAYGIYAIGAGIGFLFMPNFLLGMFGFEATSEHWIRIVAILTLGLAYYYISSAKAEDKHFFDISWKGRIWFFTASSMLAVFGVAPWNIVLIGVVDLITAIWTALTLRKETNKT